MINAGQLDRRVTIEQRSVARDAAGGETVTWSTRAEVWGSRRDITGRDRIRADQKVVEASASFLIRWRSDIASTDRLVCDGVTYDIQHMAEMGMREGLEILAKRPDAS